ncbi:MAG: VWA domain-containing protein, partial [Rhodobiaceae bacterium]|nr:VWA domain-containing protein [Rhodobiaceae bacterium]
GIWLERLQQVYESAVWLNPMAEKHWEYTPSTQIIQQIFAERMYPLTIEGLDGAMKELSRV